MAPQSGAKLAHDDFAGSSSYPKLLARHFVEVNDTYQKALERMLLEGQLAPAGKRKTEYSKRPGQGMAEASSGSIVRNLAFWNLAAWFGVILLSGGFLIALSTPALRHQLSIYLRGKPFADRHLAKPNIKQAEDTAAGFLTSASVEEQLKWVRHPAIIESRMRGWHKTYAPFRVSPQELYLQKPIHYRNGGQDCFLIVAKDQATALYLPVFLEYNSDAGFKVDWASTVSYQPMAWSKFVEERPTEPQAFRVVVQRRDQKTYRVTHPDTLYEFYALAPPDSSTAYRIDQALGSSDKMGLILRLCYEANAKDYRFIKITEFVQTGWILNYADENQSHDDC